MKKKIAVYLCAGLLIFGLAACGKDTQGTEQTGSSGNLQETPSTSESSSDIGGLDTADDGQSEDGGDGMDNDGAPEGWSTQMEGIRSAVVELLGENYWPDMALDSETLETKFGVSPEMYEDYMGEIPMMSAHVDTLVIVKAKEDQVDAVREALETYRESQVNDTLQYPMNLGKIQASKVETVGDYVIFTMLGGDDTEAGEGGEEAQIAFCQGVNDQVIDTIKGELGQ